ncbi:MAG: hypothetical protein QMC90_05530 [Dehalococcoidales bacterium]|nr:hypothetical protein [Dehalococcoidales bacterium]
MAQVMFYRYISHPGEVKQIRNERKIKSANPQGTWFTTVRYKDPDEAQRKLALSKAPTHRVGPISADEMPDFDIPLRPVAPANNQPGGGVEARIKGEVWIFGLYEFKGDIYLPLHDKIK